MKVPSFADDVAMALIEEELGQPWQNFYSELSPSPIAAGSSLYHIYYIPTRKEIYSLSLLVFESTNQQVFIFG